MAPFPWSKPETPDEPELREKDVADPARAAWFKAWLMLRRIDKQKLGAAVVAVPTIVFLAVSGLVAWLWLAMRGLVRLIRAAFR